MTLRLNLGAGSRTDPGWTHIDRKFPHTEDGDRWIDGTPDSDLAATAPYIERDLCRPLPFADSSVDYAVCHHVLDLLELTDVSNLLREVHRVLKPGGVLRCSGADLARGVVAAIAGDYDFFAEKIRVDESRRVDHVWLEATVGNFITQGGARKHWLSGINVLAEIAGFDGASDVVWFNGNRKTMCDDVAILDLDSRHEESWFAEAWK